jgi:hypothetical protein
MLKVDWFGGIGEPLGLESCFEEAGAGCEDVGVQSEALQRGCLADYNFNNVGEVISKQSVYPKMHLQ